MRSKCVIAKNMCYRRHCRNISRLALRNIGITYLAAENIALCQKLIVSKKEQKC